jgi:hypothetical protein
VKKWLTLLLLFAPALCFSQGVRIDNIAIRGANPLQSVNNAVITVCTVSGTGTPCTPLATTYTDATLNTPCSTLTQVVLAGTTTCVGLADNFGNYGFWVAPGTYVVTITAVGVPSYTTTITASVCKESGNIRCVDAGNSANWPGTDVGAWINAAYADLPSSAGKTVGQIQVTAKSDGTCYAATTRIVMGTAGKPAMLEGNGACIDYSASGLTTGAAMTLDWGQANGTQGGLRNLVVLGPCLTIACSGITLTGINIGPSNGAISMLWQNVSAGIQGGAKGFTTGINFVAGLSYVNTLLNTYAFSNKTGMSLGAGVEGVRFIGGSFGQNDTGVSNAGSEAVFSNISFDDNATVAVSMSSGDFYGTLLHFENVGGGVSQYITSTGGSIKISDSQFADDRTTASTTQMITASAGDVAIWDSDAVSNGHTLTQVVTFSGSSTGSLSFNITGSGIGSDYNHAYGGFVIAKSNQNGTLTSQGFGCRLDAIVTGTTLSQANCIVQASVNAGGFTIQLPHAKTGSFWQITRTDTSGNTLTVQGDTGQINNAASVTFAASSTHVCHVDGTNSWCN